MEHSLNETDRPIVRRENGRSRRGGSRWAAKVSTDICWVSAQRSSDPRAGIRHLSVPGGKRKNHLPRPSLCRFVHSITQQDVTIPKFIQGTIFPRLQGIFRKRETQRSDKASSAVESQCRAAEQRGFLPTSASAAAGNYLGSRLTWKGSIIGSASALPIIRNDKKRSQKFLRLWMKCVFIWLKSSSRSLPCLPI